MKKLIKKQRLSKRTDPATKGDLKEQGTTLRREFKADMNAMEYRILEQMSLLLEHHRDEIIGATMDEVEGLKTRMTRVEVHVGIGV